MVQVKNLAYLPHPRGRARLPGLGPVARGPLGAPPGAGLAASRLVRPLPRSAGGLGGWPPSFLWAGQGAVMLCQLFKSASRDAIGTPWELKRRQAHLPRCGVAQ